MKVEMFQAVLEKAECETKEKTSTLPEGRTLTLYVAHDGVAMTISKLVTLELEDDRLEARDHKGEIYVLSLDDVFAASVSGGDGDGSARKTGFLG